MKTAITGFDSLFGGGGLIIADRLASQPEPVGERKEPAEGAIGGRAVLTIGRYGTGKSR